MGDTTISEIITMIVDFMIFLMLLAVFYVGIGVQQLPEFKQEVDSAIQREGGLTAKNMNDLERISSNDYHGFYTINKVRYDSNHDGKLDSSDTTISSGSDDRNIEGTPQDVQFGTAMEYQVSVDIPIPFSSDLNSGSQMSLPTEFKTQSVGRAVTQVRSITDK